MKRRQTSFTALIWALALAVLLPAAGNATDVTLYPGYISGQIFISADGMEVKDSTFSASGGGNGAYHGALGDKYSLTVQTGDFDTRFEMQAHVTEADGSDISHSYITFSNRTFRIAEAETIDNNYHATGTIRFNVSITGDDFTKWRAGASAIRGRNGENERTYTQGGTNFQETDGGSWLMVVVPNEQIKITAGVTVDDVYYPFFNGADEYLFMDVGDGETVNVNLDINHVKPPPPEDDDEGETPPPLRENTGTANFNVYLDMNIDGENLNSSIDRHALTVGQFSLRGYSNPTDLQQDLTWYGENDTQQFIYRAETLFKDAPWLKWPLRDPATQYNYFPVERNTTTYLDVYQTAGRLTGHLKFTGTLTNADMTTLYTSFKGVKAWDPASQTHIRPVSLGGSVFFDLDPRNNPEGELYGYFTEGPWASPQVSGRKEGYEKGYYSKSDIYVIDYNYTTPDKTEYESYLHIIGQPTYIAAGETTVYEREHCFGTAVVRFRVDGRGLLSKPRALAQGGIRNGAGRLAKYYECSSESKAYKVEVPEVDIYGPTAQYKLKNLEVIAEDGSRVTFSDRTTALACGIDKEFDIFGPQIRLDTPEAYSLINESTVQVTGKATDDFGVVSVTVNGAIAPIASTGNPDDPNEVEFTYILPVTSGTNTITVTAYDEHAYQATDRLEIYADQWIPTAAIHEPAGDAGYAPGTVVPVSVETSDRGYGFTMNVYLDGALLYTRRHTPVDDQDWNSMEYNTSVTATTADQVVTVQAIDDAGNSASASVTIKGSIEVPVGLCSDSINANSKGKFPVKILGSADIDASLIDMETVTLMGVSAAQGALEDNDCSGNADGYADLVLHFDTQAVIAAIEAELGRTLADGESVAVTLTGSMFDGSRINGEDTVTIIKKRK